jgi:hypothetical protein
MTRFKLHDAPTPRKTRADPAPSFCARERRFWRLRVLACTGGVIVATEGNMRRTIDLARASACALLLFSAVGCEEGEPAEQGVAGSAGQGVAGSAGQGVAGSTEQGVAGAAGALDCPSQPAAPAGSDVLDGDLVISTIADALAAQDLSEISGTLQIAPTFPGVLSLPNLVRVGKDVYLEGHVVAGAPEAEWAQITELRLPNLAHIGGQLFVYLTGALTETDFRKLEAVGERVYFMRNLALRRIGLDLLKAADVGIQASPRAAACEIDAVCGQVGGCGAEYSDPNCTCELRCGRLEPSCAAWQAGG